MENCIFCKIINREVPSEIVYEDDEIIAFRDIHPCAPVHVLVIPKKHISSLVELQEEDEKVIGRIYTVINKIAEKENILEKGYRVIINCGEDGCKYVNNTFYIIIQNDKNML